MGVMSIASLYRFFCFGFLLFVSACSTLEQQIEVGFFEAEQQGARLGLVVVELDGTPIVSIRGDERFMPASTQKLVTTAAAFHSLEKLTHQNENLGTQLWLLPSADGGPASLILRGGADAMLSDAPDCRTSCLRFLADMIMDREITSVDNIIGDDRLFPDEKWPEGWSWEDLRFYYGAVPSALSVDNNLVRGTAFLDPKQPDRVQLEWEAGADLFTIKNETTVTQAGQKQLKMIRSPGSEDVLFYGSLPQDSSPFYVRLGVDNGALLAAHKLRTHLEKSGVTITGETTTFHRAPGNQDIANLRSLSNSHASALPDRATLIGALPASPLTETMTVINKESQNLHAEILLRRLGLLEGTGASADGIQQLEQLFEAANISAQNYDFTDGSGLSIYNRMTPQALTDLLLFAEKQDWGTAWRATLPVGGVDGSLKRRFKDTPLEGKIQAKTGGMSGVQTLAGFMETASGKTVVFTLMINDAPLSGPSVRRQMDQLLVQIAQNH